KFSTWRRTPSLSESARMDEQVAVNEWRAAWRSPLRFAAMFFGVLVLLLFLWATRSILVTSFIGLLFAVAIMPVVEWLQRHHIPRGAGAALIVAAVFAVLFGIGALLAPVLQTQAKELQQR